MESTYHTLRGKPFHILTEGNPDHPKILFLHGFPEYSGAWAGISAQLSDQFFCIAPDQRGYGQSWREGTVTDYAARELAADAAAFIDHFGGPMAVVGHDWGASVAYALAIGRPDLVSRLVIANGVHPVPFQRELAKGGPQSEASGYIERLRMPKAHEKLAADDFALMFAMFQAKMDTSWLTEAKKDGYRAAWRDAAGVNGMVNWYRATPLKVAKPGVPVPPDELPNWDPEALRVRMPHLLLWGLGDRALLPETRDGLADYCDDLAVEERDDADHWIIHQHPDWVAENIREFLGG